MCISICRVCHAYAKVAQVGSMCLCVDVLLFALKICSSLVDSLITLLQYLNYFRSGAAKDTINQKYIIQYIYTDLNLSYAVYSAAF